MTKKRTAKEQVMEYIKNEVEINECPEKLYRIIGLIKEFRRYKFFVPSYFHLFTKRG